MKKTYADFKTDITYSELLDAYNPIWEVAIMLRLQSDDLFGSIKDKLEISKATLFPLMQKIENENPEQFT